MNRSAAARLVTRTLRRSWLLPAAAVGVALGGGGHDRGAVGEPRTIFPPPLSGGIGSKQQQHFKRRTALWKKLFIRSSSAM